MNSERLSGPLGSFRVGINYWPARTAMAWWTEFDPVEVREDFARLADTGFDSVRIFLRWEDFQPRPVVVDTRMIGRLIEVMDLALAAGLSVMPTLFTGHMSGVNWIPDWALASGVPDGRFRVVSGGRVVSAALGNWYGDPDLARAQAFLAKQLARALAGHPAMWAWDLGNENSNCVVPPTVEHGRSWLRRLNDALREGDGNTLVTIGLHMEDLEEDRRLGPAQAAEVCDFLTMHGYPGYAKWARGPTDEHLLAFLAIVTSWLAGGAEVVFSEFGVPTLDPNDPAGASARERSTAPLLTERVGAGYIERALRELVGCGCVGAMVWCYADYAPAIWSAPPLDQAVHERYFGHWRADGSAKPAVAAIKGFTRRGLSASSPQRLTRWIDLLPRDFYGAASQNLARLYANYCREHAPNDERTNCT